MSDSRHNPSAARSGEEISAGVRRAVASWFNDHDVNLSAARRRFFQRFGYGDVDDVADDIRQRWGGDAREKFYEDLQHDPAVDQWNYGPRRKRAANAVSVFHVPAPLYLDYVSDCIDVYAEPRRYTTDPASLEYTDDPYLTPVTFLNGLFSESHIPYRFNRLGRAEWRGDEGAHEVIIRPALDMLEDPRLVGCRQEFEAAVGHLRKGTQKDLEDAIEEAWKSVESAMKILLDAHGIPPPEKGTTEPLWIALRDGGIIETPTRDAVVATSRIRNEWGHGQGGAIRVIPGGVPALAVQTAAAAIVFLGSRLP
jgi:hypothetical protein